MQKIIFSCLVALIASGSTLIAQNITISQDSIQTLLCKKWEADYSLMGGMKIGRAPNAPEMNYEFNKDKTFLLTSNNPKDKTKGTWSYDPKKKLIKLTITGGAPANIISLKEDEFIMVVDTKKATPDDPMEIKIVFKPGKK